VARYYEDFRMGEEFSTPRRTITEADVASFVGLSGDDYSLHTDEEFARGTVFGGRIAHGVLTLAVVTGLWQRLGLYDDKKEKTLVAFYGIDDLRFTAPVRAGDTIGCRLKVEGMKEKGKNGMLSLRNEVFNQEGKLVLTFVAHLLLERRKAT
jgi:3-hydroxybutyryl-CoA dehydratase